MNEETLVNELVEQGQFYKRGDISEEEFIKAVNHLVDQFVYGGKTLTAPLPESEGDRLVRERKEREADPNFPDHMRLFAKPGGPSKIEEQMRTKGPLPVEDSVSLEEVGITKEQVRKAQEGATTDMGMEQSRAKVVRMKFGKRITIKLDEVKVYEDEVRQIITACGHPEALVSDDSTLSDYLSFCGTQDTDAVNQRQIDEWMEPLGLEGLTTPHTRVVDAAKLLRQRGKPQ